MPARSQKQCRERWGALRPGLVKGRWSKGEDTLLLQLISQASDNPNWSQIAEQISGRTHKQCRERWCNSLDPSLKKSPWTNKEDAVLRQQHRKLGNQWAEIAKLLPGRTPSSVKLRWRLLLRRNRQK